MDQLFYNQLTILLSLQKDDHFVLNDKNMEKNIELTNILFKDLNNIHQSEYINQILNVKLPEDTYRFVSIKNSDDVKKLTKNKKQNNTAALFDHLSSKMVHYLQSIVDENNNTLTQDILDDIMLQYQIKFKNIINTITDDNFIWNQDVFKEAKNSVLEEIIHARFEKRGIVGIENCPVCGSREVSFTEKQIRRADEGSTIFFQCLANSEHKWRRG